MKSPYLRRILLALSLSLALPALADVAEVKKAIAEKLPKLNTEGMTVTKTGVLGLYEVFADGQLFYTDEGAHYLFLGDIVDTKNMKSMTEERVRTLTAIKFDSLPLDLAIKQVKGNGKRKIAIFSDPDCPYCKRLESTLNKVTDITTYTFLYPILALHPNAGERAKAVWCASDRRKAWDDYMQRDLAPEAKGGCDSTALDTIAALGQKHKINGTPTLVFADGQVIPGAVPAEQLEKLLNKAEERSAK